jgi:hypothetical protein
MHSEWKDSAPAGGTAADALAAAARVVILAAVSPTDGPAVVVDGSAAGAIPARSTVALQPADVGRSVLVVFENGDELRPIIVGVVQEAPVATPRAAARRSATRTEVRVDGKRLSLEAEEEISLRCGEASITLRADGRLVIKGMEIVSRARGTHKVKGATVLIN